MPLATTSLKKGYLKDLIIKYDHNNSKNLVEFSKIIGINITTLRAINKGQKVTIEKSIKKIADYFNIKKCFVENSILTEKEAKEFLKKRKEVPSIMRKNNDQHN